MQSKEEYRSGDHGPQTRQASATCDVGVHWECWDEHVSVPVDDSDDEKE